MSQHSSSDAFDLNDFRQQILRMRRMGAARGFLDSKLGLEGVLGGLAAVDLEGEIRRIVAMIDSMTLAERRDPRPDR